MPRVLLLVPTTTYRTQPFVEAAGRVGVDVTIASEEASTLAGLNPTGLITLDFGHPDHAARQAIAFAARHPIDAVVPVDDQVTVAAAAIAAALRLPCNSMAAAEAARNKHRMRELLAAAGLPSPRFLLVPLDADPADLGARVPFPCVVKPLDLSGSRGVIRANDPPELTRAVHRLRAILKSEAAPARGRRASRAAHDASSFLVEEFIPGREVALEGLLTGGRLDVLALFDKPDPLDGPFFEETIYVTPSRLPSEVQEAIARSAARATAALGLRQGPVHAELRVNEAGPWIVEVAGRSIGGLCSQVLRFGVGTSLEELILRHALDPESALPPRERQPSGVMMIPIPRAGVLGTVCGIDAARAVPGIEQVIISAHRGQRLVPLPEGSLYLGFLFARADSPAAVEAALRTAHTHLEFEIHDAGDGEAGSVKQTA